MTPSLSHAFGRNRFRHGNTAIQQPPHHWQSCTCCAPWQRAERLRHAASGKVARVFGNRPFAAAGRGDSTGAQAALQSIDVHHHIAPRCFVDAVGPERLVNSYPASRKAAYDWTPAMAIEDMDRGGTATAVTSLYSAHHLAELKDARRIARECNEYAARMREDYPGRFGVFACLPMPDVEGSLKEVEYALDVLKADGIYMVTSYAGKWLGDASFLPVFEELNRRKALLYTHPVVPEFAQDLIDDIPDTVIEIGTDTTRSIASMLFGGTAGRCPELDIIWSHGGGTILPVLERFERLAQRPQIAARLPRGMQHEVQRWYYDVAQVAHPVPMAALRKMVPLSQILFGTDFTFRTAAEINAGLEQCGLTPQELRAIRRDNALRLLPRYAR
jgi:predicted TIM-barrel fold metal-dependent hydrolase